jgi:hypothetical protein
VRPLNSNRRLLLFPGKYADAGLYMIRTGQQRYVRICIAMERWVERTKC